MTIEMLKIINAVKTYLQPPSTTGSSKRFLQNVSSAEHYCFAQAEDAEDKQQPEGAEDLDTEILLQEMESPVTTLEDDYVPILQLEDIFDLDKYINGPQDATGEETVTEATVDEDMEDWNPDDI